jgi:ankyrin repeat protein/L-ascorbate metabolism protein UlaG (beta-lactamase superfamily)
VRFKFLAALISVILFWTACPAQVEEIHEAARSGDIARLESLLEQDTALIDARDEDRHTPLHSAAAAGRVDAVMFLLERGADPDARNTADQSPLLYAAFGNHAGIVEALIERGAPFDYRDTRNMSPLMFASRQGSAEVVRLLVEKGAAFDEPGFRGRTPLHFAAMNGHVDIVEFLVGKGASLDKADEDGLTPLGLALTRGHAGTAEAMLTSGAALDLDKKTLSLCLHLAAAAGSNAIVGMMIEKGADPGSTDEKGRTLLHNAVIGGLDSLAEQAIDETKDIDAADIAGRTALFYAVSKGDETIVDLLLRHGADPNIADAGGRTPLHVAEDNARGEIISALRAAGATAAPRPVYPLSSGAAASSTGAGPASVEITYVANEGFMIAGGGGKILIDAVERNPWGYASTTERIFSMMCENLPPFENIDLCVASHAHADHMLARMNAELLERNARVVFVSSPAACDSVETLAGDGFSKFKDRMVSVDPEWRNLAELELKGIDVAFFGVNHAGPGQTPFKTLATIVDLGGVRLAHLADQAAPSSAEFYEAVDLKKRGVDIVFADRFFLADSTGQHLMSELIDPEYVVLMHLRDEEIDAAVAELSPLYPNLVVFREQLEKKVFAKPGKTDK